MTVAVALEFIPRRMTELGFEDNYSIAFRHFVLKEKETIEVDAYNQLFILIEDTQTMTISSEFGVYDLVNLDTNEQMYEHNGLVTITNNANTKGSLKFIQVIPKHKK